jgi:hypothetical protein
MVLEGGDMETAGKELQGGDAEARREAARALGSARTPAKSAAAKLRNEKRKGVPLPEETRRKLSEAGKERWEKIRQEKAAVAAASPPVVKERKPMGRPRTTPAADPNAPKRGRGRPKKQDETTADIG